MHANRAKTPTYSEPELLDELVRRDVRRPSERQLRRLRPLLSKAEGERTGRPGRPRLRYAAEAVDQLELITRIQAGRKVPTEVLVFELWWHGFAVADAHRAVESVLANEPPLIDEPSEPFSVADAFAATIQTPSRDPVARFLLSRVGGDRAALSTGTFALAALFQGEDPKLDSTAEYADADDRDEISPLEASVRLLGFDRAVADEAPGGSRLLDEIPDLEVFVAELIDGEPLDLLDVARLVRQASVSELELARDDAHVIALLTPLVRMGEQVYGGDFAGLGFFAIERGEQSERHNRANTVAMMLKLRKSLGDQPIDALKDTLLEVARARPNN
jgi:hypothetical protein